MSTATPDQVKQAILATGASGTAAEVLATITAPTIEKRNTDRWTYAGLAVALGTAKVSQLDAVLVAIGLEWVRLQLGGSGIDFSDPEFQKQLQRLCDGGAISAEDCAALAGLGIWQESPLEVAAGQRGVTTDLTTVESALAELSAPPPVFDRRSILCAINIDHTGKVRVSLRISEASESGQQGSVIRQIVSADAATDEALKPLYDLIRALAEG